MLEPDMIELFQQVLLLVYFGFVRKQLGNHIEVIDVGGRRWTHLY